MARWLWLLVAALAAWLFWQRWQKGSFQMAVLYILGLAGVVYALLALLLFAFQSRLVFMPWRPIEAVPKDYGLPYEDVRIVTADGQTLAAWFVPVPDAQYTVLFAHGNAGNISHRLDTLALFYRLGLNCLIFDYRGYGQSTGRPTEEGVIEDMLASRRWLMEHKGISPAQMIFFGRSLGGAVAAIAAAKTADQPPAALVIESSFTSIIDMGRHLYPWLPVQWFSRFRFDAATAVSLVRCPVVIIHSPDDEMIPYAMGKRLYEAAHEPKQFFDLKGTHNEGFLEHIELYRQIWQQILLIVSKSDS